MNSSRKLYFLFIILFLFLFYSKTIISASASWSSDSSVNLQISNLSQDEYAPKIIGDGNEGFYIVWYNGNNSGIYINRIDRSGNKIWSEAKIIGKIADTYYSSILTVRGNNSE